MSKQQEPAQETAAKRILVGKPQANQKLREITGDDPWKESPFYGAGENESEHINPIEVGDVLCGVYHGLRVSSKANKSGGKSTYVCMETNEGEKFRVFAPTQLINVLEREASLKQYVELEYMGVKQPIGDGRPYHNFTVRLGEILN